MSDTRHQTDASGVSLHISRVDLERELTALKAKHYEELLSYQRVCDGLQDECFRLRREVAWLRSGGLNRFNHTSSGIRRESVAAHLASSPPADWEPT